jgi:hypothetical protein
LRGMRIAPRSSCGLVAEWLCSGLQIRVCRFDSGPGLHFSTKKYNYIN